MHQPKEPWTPTAMEMQAVSTLSIWVSATSGAGKGWNLMTAGTKSKAPAPPNSLQLQNRFTILEVEEESHVPPSKGSVPSDTNPCKTIRKKQWAIIMGNSLLQGTEALICWPDLSTREFCCLLGPRTGILWRDCQSLSDYFPTTPCCSSTWSPMILQRETWTLSKVTIELWLVKGIGAQVVFLSVLLVRGKGVGRRTVII